MQFGIIDIPDIIVWIGAGVVVLIYMRGKSLKGLRKENKHLKLQVSIARKKKELKDLQEKGK